MRYSPQEFERRIEEITGARVSLGFDVKDGKVESITVEDDGPKDDKRNDRKCDL